MQKIYSENKKAYYDYEILEKYEAGLVLIGQEVKSIKMGRVNLAGSYVVMRPARNASRAELAPRSDAGGGNEPYLVGAKIPPYQPKNTPENYSPEQPRKLLLNKKEINYLAGRINQKGFSLIPLKLYGKNGRVKLEFGLARGKKKYDKKEKIKKKDLDREIKRELK